MDLVDPIHNGLIDDLKMLTNSLPPLAERMRPSRLEDLIGQEHLVGSNGIIRKAIATSNVPSMILWGPPGVGKTTIANIIEGTLLVAIAFLIIPLDPTKCSCPMRSSNLEGRMRSANGGREFINIFRSSIRPLWIGSTKSKKNKNNFLVHLMPVPLKFFQNFYCLVQHTVIEIKMSDQSYLCWAERKCPA